LAPGHGGHEVGRFESFSEISTVSTIGMIPLTHHQLVKTCQNSTASEAHAVQSQVIGILRFVTAVNYGDAKLIEVAHHPSLQSTETMPNESKRFKSPTKNQGYISGWWF
jgi:hypothetical protein